MSESASKGLTEAAKRQRAAYYRDWRRRNPGKASEYQKRYWERKSQQVTIEEASNEELDAKCVNESSEDFFIGSDP